MECIKNRNSWSMKKQPAKRSPVHTVILSTLGCWGLSPGCTHSPQIVKPVLQTQSWILILCSAFKRATPTAALRADLRAVFCTPGACSPCLSDPAPPNKHCTFWSHCLDINAAPLQCPAASQGLTDQDRAQTSLYFTALCYFLSTDLLEMHLTVSQWPSGTHFLMMGILLDQSTVCIRICIFSFIYMCNAILI